MRRYTDENMFVILGELRETLRSIEPGATLSFEVCHPDLRGNGAEGRLLRLEPEGRMARVRSLRLLGDLAELLGCRLMMPAARDNAWVVLTLQKLDPSAETIEPIDPVEKYGIGSPFSAIEKQEEPYFLHGFLRALDWVRLEERDALLDLGVNHGDELRLIKRLRGESFDRMQVTGIDHCPSAIAVASERFEDTNVVCHCHDINRLDALCLSPCDLLISIGTLHSPGIDGNRILMEVVQRLLKPSSGVVLGFPNCRYVDGEVVFGAKMKNFAESELSLVLKDLYFAKRYLQQHQFKVTIFGKQELFLCAIR